MKNLLSALKVGKKLKSMIGADGKTHDGKSVLLPPEMDIAQQAVLFRNQMRKRQQEKNEKEGKNDDKKPTWARNNEFNLSDKEVVYTNEKYLQVKIEKEKKEKEEKEKKLEEEREKREKLRQERLKKKKEKEEKNN
jgi:hypothetical protein